MYNGLSARRTTSPSTSPMWHMRQKVFVAMSLHLHDGLMATSSGLSGTGRPPSHHLEVRRSGWH